MNRFTQLMFAGAVALGLSAPAAMASFATRS